MRHFHLGQRDGVLRADLGVAVGAFAPDMGDLLGDFLVTGAAA